MSHDPVNTWSGEFGDEYTQRCSPEEFRIRARTRLWSRWLDAFGTREPQTICEVGCNLGPRECRNRIRFGAEASTYLPLPLFIIEAVARQRSLARTGRARLT